MGEMETLQSIKQRYSCRAFDGKPIANGLREDLSRAIEALPPAPFGSKPRFVLLAAAPGDASSLKGLGTYGFISNPAAFIVGMPGKGERAPEDFGFLLEILVLEATRIGLGSCWLGGTFTKSRFAKAAGVSEKDDVDCVIALGNIPMGRDTRHGLLRVMSGGARRKPWKELFFDGGIERPFDGTADTKARLGLWVEILDAVRSAPSASNGQPWRLVRSGGSWRLYLQRSPGYGKGILNVFLKIGDHQRVDIGIAMAHFSLAADALGLSGRWIREEGAEPFGSAEYVATWRKG